MPTLVKKGFNVGIANSAGATSAKGHSSNCTDQVQNVLDLRAGERGDNWLYDARCRLAVHR